MHLTCFPHAPISMVKVLGAWLLDSVCRVTERVRSGVCWFRSVLMIRRSHFWTSSFLFDISAECWDVVFEIIMRLHMLEKMSGYACKEAYALILSDRRKKRSRQADTYTGCQR